MRALIIFLLIILAGVVTGLIHVDRDGVAIRTVVTIKGY